MPGKPPAGISMETSKTELLFFQSTLGLLTLFISSMMIYGIFLLIQSIGFNILWFFPIAFISWLVGRFLFKDV